VGEKKLFFLAVVEFQNEIEISVFEVLHFPGHSFEYADNSGMIREAKGRNFGRKSSRII